MVVDFEMIGSNVVAIWLKMQHVITQRLTRLVSVIRLVELANKTGPLTHWLQVALIANVILKFGWKFSRIDDRLSRCFELARFFQIGGV